MKLKHISMLLGVLAFSACSDFLDVKPVGKLIPTEVGQYENLLNNSFTVGHHFLDGYWGCPMAYLGDNIQVSENQAKYDYSNNEMVLDRYAAHIFYYPYENPLLPSSSWSAIYKASAIFNTVIEGIADLGMEEDEYAQGLLAQAYAGRSWSYLVGTLGFGPMYDPDGANDVRCFCYRTATDPSVPNPQLSTTGEMFDLIEPDLNYAVEHAPDNVANPSRASKTAAYALRALYYMYRRDWEKMYQDADEAWTRSLAVKGGVENMLYDYDDFYYLDDDAVSPYPGEDKEVYLRLMRRDGDVDFTESYSREHLFYRVAAASIDDVYPSDDFVALFDKDTDQRYKLFMLHKVGFSIQDGTGLHEDGVRLCYLRGVSTMENAGITYPEVLLMRAEAQARLHRLPGALADLNLLRQYRYEGEDTDLPGGESMTEDQLLEEILKERRREMPYGSFQRIFDLRRYALDEGKPWQKLTITHQIGDKTYSAQVTDKVFLEPMSNDCIEMNPHWGLTKWEGTYDPKGAE